MTTDDLPIPKSRTEEFLAKAAGMSGVELPTPASREELYLNAIAEGGGGGGTSYTAGDGIDITDSTISVDTDTIQPKLTAGTGIDITDNTISATGGGATGEAKELTSADYNWNWSAQNATTTPFDTVALWLLEPGMYYNKSGVKVATSKTSADTNESSYLVGVHAFYTDIVKNYPGGDVNGSIVWYKTRTDNGAASNIGLSTYQNFLTRANLTNATGASPTDVMSQNAVTSMIFADPSTAGKIKILGAGLSESQFGAASISMGSDAKATSPSSVAIGRDAYASHNGSVALGAFSTTDVLGQVHIGTTVTNFGYNSSNYRLLSGVYDGQTAHDAATLAQGNTLATSAPTTSTVGVLGQLYTDTTNMHTYQCTAISGSTYTWTQRW